MANFSTQMMGKGLLRLESRFHLLEGSTSMRLASQATLSCMPVRTQCHHQYSKGQNWKYVPVTLGLGSTANRRVRSDRWQCRVVKKQVESPRVVSPGQGGRGKPPADPRGGGDGGPSWETLASSAGGLFLWAAFAGYAIFLSPNQTPYRDSYFVEKLIGQGSDDGIMVNVIFSQFWNLLGVLPATFWALIIPSSKSGNKVPAWPFLTGSLALGFLALGPYFALWTPSDGPKGPPPKTAMEGWGNLSLRITESRIFAALLFGGAVISLAQVAMASGAQWVEFGKLFDESRLVHVSTLDLTVLTLCAPFWMFNDAARREWEPRDKFLPFLAAVPILGPTLYLLLRPRAGSEEQ